MRAILVLSGLMLALPASADCIDDIRAAYDNPFERPAYRTVKRVFDASGKETMHFVDVVDTPLKTISAINGADATMAIDQEYWTGPGPDGPWTKGGSFPQDREASIRAAYEQESKNMTEVECLGEADRDGATYVRFRFLTKTDPDAAGTWFGARNDIWVGLENGLIIHWDQTDFTSSWAPQVSKEVHTRTLDYDDTISITAPQ